MNLDPVMQSGELEDYIYHVFPEIHDNGKRPYSIEHIEPGRADIRFSATEKHLRPGGTVSGPAMMALADLGLYAVILAHIGPVSLAVTTNLNINFLRKPAMGDLTGEARLLKLGKRLAVGEVYIRGIESDVVAHATGTYSIPPER